MTKRIIKLILLCTVLCTVLATALGAALLVGADARNVEKHEFSVTFDLDKNIEVYLKSADYPSEILMENGKVYQIQDQDLDFRVRVKVNGYTTVLKNEALGNKLPEEKQDGDYYTWSIMQNTAMELVCTPETYSIVYVTPIEGSIEFAAGVENPYTYAYNDKTTALPTPIKNGYVFVCWENVPANSPTAEGTPLPITEGKTYLTTTIPQNGQTLYVRPKWEAIKYPFFRYDYILGGTRADFLGEYKGEAAINDKISGNTFGGEMHYPGFYFEDVAEHYTADRSVYIVADETEARDRNYAERYYTPITYTLKFENGLVFPEGTSLPTTHKFDVATSIPSPTRTGYNFVGWTVTVIKNGQETKVETEADLTVAARDERFAGDKDTELVFTAKWEAKKFTVTAIYNNGSENGSLTYAYDTGLTVPTPTRKGYTFAGWKVTVGGEVEADLNMTGKLEAATYLSDITVEAQWKPITYTVKLDGNGATVQGTPTVKFTFDAPLDLTGIKLPTREGHTFLGFFSKTENGVLYIKPDGTSNVQAWDIADEDPVLYAVWQANKYTVTLNFANGTATINGLNYTGPVEIEYGTALNIVVVANENYMVTAWNGTAVKDPEKVHTVSVTVPVDGLTIDITIAPEAPAMGEYITNVDSPDVNSILVMLNQNATPDFPYEIAWLPSVEVLEALDHATLNWTDLTANHNSGYLIKDLNPGTYYTIFIRAKAVEGKYPSGVIYKVEANTKYKSYLQGIIDGWNRDLENAEGELAKSLLQKAIDAATALMEEIERDGLPYDFNEKLNAIIADVKNNLPLETAKDKYIAVLNAKREELLETGAFSTESQSKINSECDAAINTIKNSTTQGDVKAICDNTLNILNALKITYLFADGLKLTALMPFPDGFVQGTQLTVVRLTELAELTALVDATIANPANLATDGSLTPEAAVELLSSLDVMGAWKISLIPAANVNGSYEFFLTLDDDLNAISGLQIAVCREDGTLQLLKTEREGNVLKFTADCVGQFVLLGDPTLNLSTLIIALGLALACQLIAIILLMARRAKNARAAGARHAVTLVPTLALAIRFLPVNGLQISLILGAAVLICQIILMYLLLTSDVFHKKNRKDGDEGNAQPQEDSYRANDADSYAVASVFAEDAVEADGAYVQDETELAEEEAVLAEELLYDENGEPVAYAEEDPFTAFDEASDADEAAPLSADGEVYEDAPAEDVFVSLTTGEVFGDTEGYEDFIEPAATPRYSLPEEEPSAEQSEQPAYGDEDIMYAPTAEVPAYDAYGEPAAPSYEPDGDAFAQDAYEIPAEEAAPVEEAEASEETSEEEPVTYSSYEYDDDDVRGEPAEDLPQEEPATGTRPPYEI